MKLEGWKIKDKSDGSVAILLVSKHYFKENVLSRFLDASDTTNDNNIDKDDISITIPDTPKEGSDE